jgi:hypothetical protein
MATPTPVDPATAAVQAIQVQKETALQKANAVVMTDANATHAVVTPWKSKPTGVASVIGAIVGFPFGGPLGSVAGAAIGATVEHYLRPVGRVTAKLGVLQPKPAAPAAAPGVVLPSGITVSGAVKMPPAGA